jgi:hypothetical protein
VIAGSRAPSGRLAAVAIATAFGVVIACTSAPSPVPSVVAPAPTASSDPASSGMDSAGPSDAASPLVAIDPALLDLLPATVGGNPLVASPDAATDPASDPSLAKSAQSIAVGLAVDQASGDLVVASVVKLKPGVFSDEFFRDWRDSFDQGVCGQAGGVAGNAQATMDGRTVFIGTCDGGVHTYHVHLEGPDVIVSLNSVGEGRLGEQLMESLPD